MTGLDLGAARPLRGSAPSPRPQHPAPSVSLDPPSAYEAVTRQMVTDHEAMLKDAKSLATKLNAQADTANGDAKDLLKDANDELKELTDKAAGADWDKEFIEKEVDGHQHVLDKLQDAAKNTTDPDLRAALEKATGKVQQHLTKAQDIQAKLK